MAGGGECKLCFRLQSGEGARLRDHRIRERRVRRMIRAHAVDTVGGGLGDAIIFRLSFSGPLG